MSNQAQGLVRNLALTAPLKPVLMAYAAYADELGYTWAGVEVIAFDTGYAPSTVKQARRELTAAGWLASKRRFGTSSIVRLNLDRMATEAVDRGEGRRIHPELEFEPDSPENRRSAPVVREPDDCIAAGRPQLSGSRTTVAREGPAPGQLDIRDPDEYSSGSRTVFVSDSSDDSSVDARAAVPPVPGAGRHRAQDRDEGTRDNPPPGMRHQNDAPTLCALTLVTGLEWGLHRRPTTTQATELATRVDAALASGLSLVEVRRHAQATVNAAKPPREKGNAVVYLINGLAPERLPVPYAGDRGPHADVHQLGEPAADDSEGRRSALAVVRALPRARVPARRPRVGTRVSNRTTSPLALTPLAARENRVGDG